MKKILFITLFLGAHLYASQKILVITPPRVGLFACCCTALNYLEWCEKNDMVPVVVWGKNSPYYQPSGYNGSTEPWEYYFEPLCSISAKNVQELPNLTRTYKYSPGPKALIKTTRSADYSLILDIDYRQRINTLIKKYIKIKPQITRKADAFYEKHISNRHTIGIHLRGTDKKIENIPVPIEIICQAANNKAASHDTCQFFIATDDQRLLEKAARLLRGPIITYNSYRSSDGTPIHLGSNAHENARLGEEVIIETLLLSRCNAFVHTKSNVSSVALFFNPKLDNVALTH